MDESQKHFRLGLFVVITLILLFGILFILGGQSLFKPKLTFETYFDNSVSGLEVGSPVLYRGIPIGVVTSIELTNSIYESKVPSESRKSYVVVRSEITGSTEAVKDWKKNLQIAIDRGLRAQTQLAGITGQQYLSLDYMSLDPNNNEDLVYNWQPDFNYVPSAKSSTGKIIAGIQKLLASLDEADIADLGKNINGLLVTLNEKIETINTPEISKAVVELLHTANQTMTRIDTLVAQSKLDQTFSNVNSATGRLDQLLAGPELQQTLTSLAAATSALNASLATDGDITKAIVNLDQVLQRTDIIMADNQYDINSLIRDLKITAANLKQLSNDAKLNPSGVLFGSPPEKLNLEEKK
jgi:phospholipid/cholesterol/gamma-HCH transport system substrate-binding protein